VPWLKMCALSIMMPLAQNTVISLSSRLLPCGPGSVSKLWCLLTERLSCPVDGLEISFKLFQDSLLTRFDVPCRFEGLQVIDLSLDAIGVASRQLFISSCLKFCSAFLQRFGFLKLALLLRRIDGSLFVPGHDVLPPRVSGMKAAAAAKKTSNLTMSDVNLRGELSRRG